MNCPPAWESVRALILWRRDPAILFLSPSVLMGAQPYATEEVDKSSAPSHHRRGKDFCFMETVMLMGAQPYATDDVFGRSVVAPAGRHPVPCHWRCVWALCCCAGEMSSCPMSLAMCLGALLWHRRGQGVDDVDVGGHFPFGAVGEVPACGRVVDHIGLRMAEAFDA